MRKRRHKVAVIDDKLVALFRATLPARQALLHDIELADARRMPIEQRAELGDAVDAFNQAADVGPHQRGPLFDEHRCEPEFMPLRDALLAEIERQDKSAKTAVCSRDGLARERSHEPQSRLASRVTSGSLPANSV